MEIINSYFKFREFVHKLVLKTTGRKVYTNMDGGGITGAVEEDDEESA